MTTFEVELEREKSAKITLVAARGAKAAVEFGQDPDDVATFLTHYFRHVDAMDIDERSVEDLFGLVVSHYGLATQRPAARAAIAIRTPSQRDDGWTAGGATVVQIVTDDRPFLVDSVTMEVLRQGWSIREVFPPQFLVRRDLGGTLRGIVTADQADGDLTVLPESWMHLEILPPARPGTPAPVADDLEHGLLEVLRLVEEAVEDWQKMITRSEETIALLGDPSRTAGRREEAAEARELLGWVNANHFTFLGYREYRLDGGAGTDGDGTPARFVPVAATGLGILRADADAPGAFGALPPASGRADLMVVTKDNYKSRVHRP
ncbi:MAG TPA: NAD-glutamate dehydrogenase, partial [Propionibacteriaceae bacterium]|nr:NAD-glutamate dehydrogenase [Propionibacteriaceae bacterium]